MSKPALKEQIEEVGREIRYRADRYPDLIARGRLREDTARRKLAHLQAAYETLQWLEQNEAWIKREAELRAAEARMRREREWELEQASDEPVTTAAQEAFPGAEVVGFRKAESEGGGP